MKRRSRSPHRSSVSPKKVNGFENSRYSSLNCRQATAQDKVMNGFGSLMLAGHISRLMNDVSRGTEA